MNLIDDDIILIVEVDIFTFHSCASVHLKNNGEPKTALGSKGNAENVGKEGRGRKQYFAQTFVGNGKINLPVRAYGAQVATL